MARLIETDYGTPPSSAQKAVNLTIDGHRVTVPAGTSVLRAAREAGIDVPALCATDSLRAFGSCRMCLVEIEGQRGYPASCHTPVDDGMVVSTESDRLTELRRGVMELYLSDHPEELPDDGRSEMTELARKLGIREIRYGRDGRNHQNAEVDDSNPYFRFDPAACIVCSRCVRACDEVQGTLALTVQGRGFDSKIVASQDNSFFDSECVSCGACVQACPTDALLEKSIEEAGMPGESVITTCGYCGVGCSFKAEKKDGRIVRMLPYKDGQANHGHSCLKGRFAYGYSTHPDRVTSPMIRDAIDEDWREVSWDEAIDYAARELKQAQQRYGRNAVGGITSSRCTNEETYLVQKMVRAALGTNNVDTCARVCHSPTGYGLKTAFGTSAGTQHFDSVRHADVIMVIGANPTDAHPVFASQMKRRLRQGAGLIVMDPRRIDLVRTPHVKADHHLPLKPGSNVAMINAFGHVVVTEGLVDQDYVERFCDREDFAVWKDFIAGEENSPESMEPHTGVRADQVRQAARLYASAGNAAIYYGLGVTEHSQGSTMVMGMANLAMATGNLGRPGVGVSPLRGQNNVQGSCDMGSFPHEYPGYRHVSDETTRGIYQREWGVELDPEPGLRIPNMIDAAIAGQFKALYIQGEDIVQSDPNSQHIIDGLKAMDCVIVQDIFFNETARFARVMLPGSSFLEKDGTFTNAERRINRVRKTLEPLGGKADWEATCALSGALGYPMDYSHPSEIMDEIARTVPTFAGVSYQKLDELGSVQWPCNDQAPKGTPVMHVERIVRGLGKFMITAFVPTTERTSRKYPLLLTTGRILSQYNVGTQTRRTPNALWASEDILEIHPHDAEQRGIRDGELVELASRIGQTTLRARFSDRMQPGVVYTTFHFAETGANVVTTELSDWATECPEYKVTAAEVTPAVGYSEWQRTYFSEAELAHAAAIEPETT
ncbi:MAG: formate dehydrogenase subunit alpha [Pseudomonadota bacterium]|nr:MAG: formate dehydrogenase subunit alpha [Pseudomonadota bacterium]